MSHPPSSRQKSCHECVTAKRKCTQELPKCKRCAKKNIPCSYANNRATSVNSTTFPELDFPWLEDFLLNQETLPWSGGLQPQLANAATASMLTPSLTNSADEHMPSGHSSTSGYNAAEPYYLQIIKNPVKNALPRAETEAAVHRFKTWPDKWLKEGKAPFIHPRLYVTGMPKPLQDAYAACAIYSTRTPQNEFVAFTVIESKANELLQSAHQPSWTPLDLLAAVQALLIFQFIRLFDGDIRQRAQAEQAEPILEAWTEQLQTRTAVEQTYTTVTAPSWRSWIFAESVRRTVTMSFFLMGIYSLVKRGFCTLSEKVTANSFTAQSQLWEANSALEWDRARQMYKPYWVEKMNFDNLLRECKGAELDDYGLVMLITYRGQETINHWLQTDVNSLVIDQNLHDSLLNMVSHGDLLSVSSSDLIDGSVQCHHEGSSGISSV